MSSKPNIFLKDFEFGHEKALFEPLNFSCEKGEICAILGANGLGKTSLLHSIIGLKPKLKGEILVSEDIGFVPQINFIAFSYSVLDVVLMGRARKISLFKMPSKNDIDLAYSILEELGIEELAQKDYLTLSGGQKQLVLIARALVGSCDVLILDEPSSALDLKNQEKILSLICKLAKTMKKSIIFTTHSPSHALLVANTTLLLFPDKKWLFGKTKDMLSELNLKKAYNLDFKLKSFDYFDKKQETKDLIIPLININN